MSTARIARNARSTTPNPGRASSSPAVSWCSNDIEWASVQLARAYLKENFRVVDEVIEGEASYGAYEKP